MIPVAILTSHTQQPSMTCQRHEKMCPDRIGDLAHKLFNHYQLSEGTVLVGEVIGML